MTNGDDDDLGIVLKKLLICCLEHGMQPPFYMAIVAGTGACTFGRFIMAERHGGGAGFELEPLAEHMADGNPRGRVKIMMVDAVGKVLLEHFSSRRRGRRTT